MIYLFALAVSLIICFFILFIISRQDFVLLRQNISLAQIFDLSSVVFISAFIFGRIFLVVNDFNFQLLNLLTFFNIFKFEGINSLGFFAGGAVATYFSVKSRKALPRIFDIFSISFFPLFIFLSVARKAVFSTVPIPAAIIFLSILIFSFLVRSHYKYILKDGNISFVFLFLLTAETIVSGFIYGGGHKVFLNMSILQIASIPLAFVSLAFLAARELGAK